MLVVHGNITVNIDNQYEFELDEQKDRIRFSSVRNGSYDRYFEFNSYAEAYETYHAILRAYAYKKKLYIISDPSKDKTKK